MVNLKLHRWEPARWDSSRVLDFDAAWGNYTRESHATATAKLDKKPAQPPLGSLASLAASLAALGAGSEAENQAPDAPAQADACADARDALATAAARGGSLPGHLASKARLRKARALLELAKLELLGHAADKGSSSTPDKGSGSQSASHGGPQSGSKSGDEAKAAALHRDAEACLAAAAAALRHCLLAASANDDGAAVGRSSGSNASPEAAAPAADAAELLRAVEKLQAKECKALGLRVAQVRAAHDASWAKVCRERIIGGLDRANLSLQARKGHARLAEVADSMSDLPELLDSDSD
jgi:hypothetical protein